MEHDLSEHDFESEPRRIGVKIILLSLAVAAVGIPMWLVWGRSAHTPNPPHPVARVPDYRPVPVPTNRGEDVEDGFRGEVHPLLHGQARLEVVAHWTGVGTGRDQLDQTVPANVYRLFSEFKPAISRRVYTERDLSVFLPESVNAVGQTWEIRADDVAGILGQFHPQPSMHLIALGRRAGPDGAFALLRAMSTTHLEVLFRIHAEFDLAQNVWLTPACFWGRMLVDREAGTVEHFRLWVPTDNPLNMHLTVAESMPPGGSEPTVFREIRRGDMVITRRDIVRVEQMELASADPEFAESIVWTESLEMEIAERKLKKAFYTFASIDWVPWQRAAAIAAEEKRPILAIVLWGALDDQSC